MSKGIRRMTVQDAAGVHAVELESFATPWTLDAFEAEMTQNPNAYYVVADQDGIVGLLVCGISRMKDILRILPSSSRTAEKDSGKIC